MTNLLIFDTETTNIGEGAEAIELSATLYQVGSPSGMIASVSTLIPVADNPAQSINHIDPRLSHGWNPQVFFECARHMARVADRFTAFNAEFDKPFVESLLGITGSWICAYSEINWLPGWVDRPRSQIDLALSMGVGVLHAHRAGDDVRTLTACLDRLGDRLPIVIEDAIARVSTPKVQALVNLPSSRQAPPEEKATYKAAGFWRNEQWEWVRELRAYDFDRLHVWWDFPVHVLSADDRAARDASPMIEVAAQVTYEERQKASDLYFRWDGGRRAWVKEMREWDFEQGLWHYPFNLTRL